VRNGRSPHLLSLNSLLAFAPQDLFPFKAYFADAPGTLFGGAEYEADLEKARGCWRHLRTMFQELEECRAFELLKVRKKEKKNFTLFSGHDGSLLRRQPGAAAQDMLAWQLAAFPYAVNFLLYCLLNGI